jgi:hypothetical protein
MDERTKFGRVNAGYYVGKKTRPENGDIYLDGVKFLNNLPFAILQSEKRKLLAQGYTSKRIKIKYHYE